MKRLTVLGALAVLPLSLVLAGCDGDEGGLADAGDDSGSDELRIEVAGDITEDTTWSADHIYVLTGITFVKGATLTIEPGTVVEGAGGSVLVIDQDARIEAVGTADAPIVMTSVLPEGSRNRGDWGGLVLIGDAPANVGVGAAEGFPTPPPYGGQDEAHDCGRLSYLRVEWAGFELSPGNELNGITFYACGTGTSVDHVQVHMGSDDGIEMFGGNFDASHLVVTGAADDSIDCDQGFRGNLQHVFVQQDPAVGDNCLEWSNQGNDFAATPVTGPTLTNFTCVGSGAGGEKSKGVTLKEGTEATIRDALFTDITNDAMVLLHQVTQDKAEAGAIVVDGVHFCGGAGFAVSDDEGEVVGWTAADFENWVMTTGTNAKDSDCGLGSTAWGSPDVQPSASLPGVGGYAGAVDPDGDNWTLEPWITYAR